MNNVFDYFISLYRTYLCNIWKGDLCVHICAVDIAIYLHLSATKKRKKIINLFVIVVRKVFKTR